MQPMERDNERPPIGTRPPQPERARVLLGGPERGRVTAQASSPSDNVAVRWLQTTCRGCDTGRGGEWVPQSLFQFQNREKK